MIFLGGSEDFVRGCVIYQRPANKTPAGPTGCTAILVTNNNNAHVIAETHITDFYVGINLEGTGTEGLNAVYVSDVVINAVQNAALIEPRGATDHINDVHFTGCTFAATNYANTLKPGMSGVLISVPSGASASNVASIYFTGCSAYGWGNAGIEIDAGKNIVISSGQYSSNAQSPTDPSLGAGIVVAGGSRVTIVGADCSGVSELWKNTVPSPPAQKYGISLYPTVGSVTNVTASGCNLNYNQTSGLLVAASGSVLPTHVFVRGCDVSQYSSYSSAISVASSLTNAQDLEVTDCSGYNDQAPTLFGPASPPLATFYNTTFSYYGPITFYVWGAAAATIKVAALVTGLQSGSFNLPCNIVAEVTHSGPTPTFAVIGM